MFTDMALIEAFTEMVHIMKKRSVVGTAIVSDDARAPCPSADWGKTADAVQEGCRPQALHAFCTAAKNAAKAALRNAVNPACHKYITSTAPCKAVNC